MTGLVIHMEENRTSVKVPQDRYDEVILKLMKFLIIFIISHKKVLYTVCVLPDVVFAKGIKRKS